MKRQVISTKKNIQWKVNTQSKSKHEGNCNRGAKK